MSATLNLFSVNTIKHIAAVTVICTSLGMANSAFATLIDFDDLTPVYPDPANPSFGDNPLTDQYLSKGLLITNAFLDGTDSHNFMLTSDFSTLDFVGALPTFVSMNITSERGDAISLNAYGTAGLISSTHTSGWMGPNNPDIPAVPNELISFSSAMGISHISIEGFYNARTEAAIDNLVFTYAPVPEPSSIALACLGLFGIALCRLKNN